MDKYTQALNHSTKFRLEHHETSLTMRTWLRFQGCSADGLRRATAAGIGAAEEAGMGARRQRRHQFTAREDEATYILGFKDADALQASIVKAESEREQRLLSKGIRPSEADEDLAADKTGDFLANLIPTNLPPALPGHRVRRARRLPLRPSRVR